MKRFGKSAGLLVLLFAVGCRPSTPVEEVSVAESGIEVAETSHTTAESDWPGWRGPNRNGLAIDQPVAIQWSDENIKWKADVPGRGHSSPTIVGDLVVLATAIENEEKQQILAFDRTDGSKKWTTTIHEGSFPAQRAIHQKATNANGTVASDGNQLYTAAFNNGKIYVTALNLDGEQQWQTEVGAFASKFGYAPSPVLYKSLVIIAADNFGGGYLTALDVQSGEVAWRTARGDASSYSSPTVATVGGVDQLFITGGDRLASYDPATGKENWATPGLSEATCGTVVATDQHVFASGGYPGKETVCLSAEGEKIWSNRIKLYEPSLLVFEDHVYAITDGGIAYCWSADTGKQSWKERIGGNFSSSPIACNGNIYVANLSGDCFVFEANPAGYENLATNHIGDDCYASPAVSQGELFFRVGIGSGQNRTEQLICVSAQ